jgi:hypothetical protein
VLCSCSWDGLVALRCLRDSVHQQPRFDAGHEHGKRTSLPRAIDIQP